MGTLLTFQPASNGGRHPVHAGEMGKLLLFTGVRYQRDDVVAPAKKPRGRAVKTRRRT